MKKIIAILPPGYDWFSAVEHALAFGLSAALMIRVVPAICHAFTAAFGQVRGSLGLNETFPTLSLKVFGQRR